MKNKISAIGIKLWTSVIFIIVAVFFGMYIADSCFLSSIYLNRMKGELKSASLRLSAVPASQWGRTALEIEKNHGITSVLISLAQNENSFNSDLRWRLRKNNLPFNQFWIIQKNIDRIKHGQPIMINFRQPKIKNSYLTYGLNYKGKALFMVIPLTQNDEYLRLVNTSNSIVLICGLLVLVFPIWKIAESITNPLRRLQEAAHDISEMKFDTIDIKTGDEIEELAESINAMSLKLKDVHSELKRKNDVLLDAISGMSHETKTPLALIYAYAAGLRDDVVDKSAAEIILSQVQRLDELVDKMIEISRLDKEEICLSLFDLSELTRVNLDAFDIMFKQKGIALTVDIADGCLVEADRNKMNTVLVNLISNAVKYTDNAWVGVAVAGSDDACTFTIKNGNTSLSVDVLPNLWEPFYVGEKSHNAELSGTGLGLAIVKAIFEKHGIEYGLCLEDGIFSVSFRMKVPANRPEAGSQASFRS